MKLQRNVMIGIGVVAVLLSGAALLSTFHFPLSTRQGSAQAQYYCPMHPTYTSDRPGDCPICNMKLVKREAATTAPSAAAEHAGHAQAPQEAGAICYLHNCDKLHEGKPCPMTVVAKPGETVTCPVCGKFIAGEDGKLTKILYPTADGYAPVLLTPEKQQLIGIKTAPVEQRALTKTIRTAGRIAYDPDLYQTQAEYLQSLAAVTRAQAGGNTEAVAEAQRMADASRTKLRLMGLSQELIEEMADWEGPDKSLLLSDDEGRVWLYATIYEFELPFVKPGQTVSVEVPSAPNTRFTGVIRAIDSVLDPATRSARIRAVLTDPSRALKPEMFVNASVEVSVGEVLAVPEEAVFQTGTKQIVFVDQGQGLFEPRNVALGLKADGYYEVREGLSAGEQVVASGNFLIDSESRLKAALEGAAAPGHQHGP